MEWEKLGRRDGSASEIHITESELIYLLLDYWWFVTAEKKRIRNDSPFTLFILKRVPISPLGDDSRVVLFPSELPTHQFGRNLCQGCCTKDNDDFRREKTG